MNGWGFTAGVVVGIAASIIQAIFFSNAPLYIYYPIIAALSAVLYFTWYKPLRKNRREGGGKK